METNTYFEMIKKCNAYQEENVKKIVILRTHNRKWLFQTFCEYRKVNNNIQSQLPKNANHAEPA